MRVPMVPTQQSPTGAPVLPNRIGFGLSVLLFGIPAVLLWLATRIVVPHLVRQGWEPLLAWFVAGGLLVFAPLFFAALIGARRACGQGSWSALVARLRVRRLNVREWWLAGFVLVVTLAAIAALHAINASIWPRLPPHPPFMNVAPLAPSQYYILLLWLPFFAANIVGEELWWRGFIQPGQEPVCGSGTWIVQGLLHGAFHFSFGPGLIFVLLPAFFAIPWAVQRTRNTSVGMVIHGGINGLGFLVVSLGLMPG